MCLDSVFNWPPLSGDRLIVNTPHVRGKNNATPSHRRHHNVLITVISRNNFRIYKCQAKSLGTLFSTDFACLVCGSYEQSARLSKPIQCHMPNHRIRKNPTVYFSKTKRPFSRDQLHVENFGTSWLLWTKPGETHACVSSWFQFAVLSRLGHYLTQFQLFLLPLLNVFLARDSHTAPETAICHNLHNSFNWDSHITRQLGYKHTFCQNAVSIKTA